MWPLSVLIAVLLGAPGSWAAPPATEPGPGTHAAAAATAGSATTATREAGASRAADQCVACHTSAEKLQALVAPPEAVAEEGEG
jgi:mono/diheme cytochrome c family protein